MHFAHVNQSEGEDLMTVTYLRETAEQAGFRPSVWRWKRSAGTATSLWTSRTGSIQTLFKLYPWEWLVHEDFAPHIADVDMDWIEPIWKMLLSNKGLLAVMFELEPDHPNLLPTYLDGSRGLFSYVKKPRLSREGANVMVVDGVPATRRTASMALKGTSIRRSRR